MARSNPHRWYALALLAGLGAWTLAPYGGCACRNPLTGSGFGSGVTKTTVLYGGLEAGKVPPNILDDFNDGANATSPTGHWQNEVINGVTTQVWFNGNDPAYRVNFWGGSTYTQADAFLTSQYASSLNTVFASCTACFGVPPLPAGEVSACLEFGCSTCVMGHYVPMFPDGDTESIENPASCAGGAASCGATYPFIEHGIYLTPQGSGGQADVEFNGGVSVTGMTPAELATHGLEFNLSEPGDGGDNPLIVKLILLYLYNYSETAACDNSDAYCYHQYTVTVNPDGAQIQIPFSSFKLVNCSTGTPYGDNGSNRVRGTGTYENSLAAQAAEVDAYGNPTDSLDIMAIQFDPDQPSSGTGACPNEVFKPTNYQYYIDNLEFY